MRTITVEEIGQVSGGALTVAESAAATIGLMALAPASLPVMAVGAGALIYYAMS